MFWLSMTLGNALIVIDAEDELINEIDEMVREKPGGQPHSLRRARSKFAVGYCRMDEF